ncbi:3-ketoacyl-CoA thiolase, mitochondrial-like [Nymphalis io]|uniref:3-ketoacyl-CoA thiolase, mitochondrial-like n=1 Tax=Inachis io TaxID=171585 RepID=UPI00216A4187|nr:3-ketoacyl-CoA thiolase, mitochondrial-like [Nymphalis io]XP_050352657.1 3-ketoacyl-CoA thiolase, mitochondrial-like [Nymphalis io]
MALASKGIFVVGAKRTPFCKYGGSLRELPSSHAFAAAAKDALNSGNLNPSLVDSTIVGNVNFLSQCDGGKTPRYCGIYAGVSIDKPALGVNKACGSGLQAVLTGAMEILSGSANVCLTGGTEIMSSLPILVRNVRFGTTLGSSYHFEDHIKKRFLDSYTGLTLEKMAENIAVKYKISREMADNFALNSYLKWKKEQESKHFNEELTSLSVMLRKKEVLVDKDELPEANMTLDDMAKSLTLLEDGAVVTSLNSAVPADGAAALVLANEATIERNNLIPLARVSGWASVGVDPMETGLAAAPAVKKLLQVTGKDIGSVDLFEINETFAVQVLATVRELKLDDSKVNVNGGALVLGNPVAATGARMAVHLVHHLKHNKAKRGIAVSSCGGGQGVAVMFEAV